MSKAAEKQSIYLALAAILVDIEAIAKNQENKDQHFKFRSIDDLYNELHPIFRAHGVVCLPTVEKLDFVHFTNKKGNDAFHTHVMVGYRFVASDGSFVEAKSAGEGIDYSDKGTAKALSMAHKYLLVQTFLVPFANTVDADYYDPTIEPREELAKLREAQAKEKVDAAVAAGPGTKIDDKRIDQIEANREEAARAAGGAQAPITRATNEDLATGAPGTPEPPEPPMHPKPVRQKKDKPAPTVVESDAPPLPGAEPEPKAKAPAAAGPAAPPWFTYTISPQALSHAKFKGRAVGELELEELELLEAKWSSNKEFQEGIASTPVKSELRAMLRAALEVRRRDTAVGARSAKK